MLAGRSPDLIASPGSEAEAIAVVKWAAAEGYAIVPWGGGSAVAAGNRPRPGKWLALSTEQIKGVAEFSPDDMVVTARAGSSLADLQSALRDKGQFLPIDAPFPDRATLGGIVATNSQGLWRPGFGIPRDRLLGVRVVMADGSAIKGGGKVVKNVAGYDLCKLFAGSWGTLGLITEVTFKTNPLPEARSQLNFSTPGLHSGIEAALQVHLARLQPAYLCVAALPSATVCVGLMGSREAVAWQEAEITRTLRDAGLIRRGDEPSEDDLRTAIAGSDALLRCRFTVRPSDLPDVTENLQRAVAGVTFVAHVPTGILEVGAATAGLEPGPRNGQVVESISRALPDGGHLVWTRVPDGWEGLIPDVWGQTRGDFAIMRDIKLAVDPDGLFSPGRFVGRL